VQVQAIGSKVWMMPGMETRMEKMESDKALYACDSPPACDCCETGIFAPIKNLPKRVDKQELDLQ